MGLVRISMEAILGDPQNDWTATQNHVNHDVFAQAPSDLQRVPPLRCLKLRRWLLVNTCSEQQLGVRFYRL